MEPVACGQCGKCDDAMNMFVCSGCFEFHFCSEDHFNQHPHSKIEDAIHADIEANPFRKLRTSDFSDALKQLAVDYTDAVDRWVEMPDKYSVIAQSSISMFAGKVAKKREHALATNFKDFIESLNEAMYDETLEMGRNRLISPSNEILRLISADRLRGSKEGKKKAWWQFINTLLAYKKTDNKKAAKTELNQLAVRVGRVLGGGKE